MRRRVEMMDKTNTAQNGRERTMFDRDNIKHLQYFKNGQWRDSDKCKQFVNKDCTVTIGKKHSDY
jgi:hypothetical protein